MLVKNEDFKTLRSLIDENKEKDKEISILKNRIYFLVNVIDAGKNYPLEEVHSFLRSKFYEYYREVK